MQHQYIYHININSIEEWANGGIGRRVGLKNLPYLGLLFESGLGPRHN